MNTNNSSSSTVNPVSISFSPSNEQRRVVFSDKSIPNPFKPFVDSSSCDTNTVYGNVNSSPPTSISTTNNPDRGNISSSPSTNSSSTSAIPTAQQSIIQDIDTTKYEEIPAKEPDLSRLPEKSALKKPNAVKRRVIPVLRENQRPSPRPSPKLQPELLVTPSSNDIEDDDDEHSSSDEENHEPNKRFANVKRNDSLARFLKDRPLPNELYEKNILVKPLDERKNERETIETKLERKLSLRPRPEELEARNILRAQTAAELIAEKEEKKRVLLRKLSFRPSIQGKILIIE